MRLDVAAIREAYLAGESVDSLRRRYAVGHAKIQKLLRRSGVVLRSHWEATTAAQQRRKGSKNSPGPWIGADWRPPSP